MLINLGNPPNRNGHDTPSSAETSFGLLRRGTKGRLGRGVNRHTGDPLSASKCCFVSLFDVS